MHFICSRNALNDALQIVTKALASRTTNSILECVLMETDSDQLVLTCTDDRITIVTRIPAEIMETGRGVIPGKFLTDTVRKLSGEEVELRSDNRSGFILRSGNYQGDISGQDVDLFPTLPRMEDEREISLPQNMLREMIQKTEFAISQDDMREVLTGCLLEIRGGDVTMVALDGYRMALRRAKCSDVLEQLSAIIPGRAVSDIGKLLSDDEDAFVQLSFGGNKLHIRLDNTEIFVILVDGEYVDYRQILPKSHTTRVEIDLEEFRSCIDRAALNARGSSNNLISLKIEGGKMVIAARSQVSGGSEPMDIVQNGPDLTIAFNVKYLTDMVRIMDSERVEMQMNNAISPCIVVPVDDSDYLHLILPVRTGAY